MICPNCLVEAHDRGAIVEPACPEDYIDQPLIRSFWSGELIDASNKYSTIAEVVIARKPHEFQFVERDMNGLRKNFRIRLEHCCQQCGFVWDQFIGDPDVESYRFTPQQKFIMILTIVVGTLVTSVFCSLIWAYHWKQVRMAEAGFEKREVPGGNRETVTEWRKVTPNPDKP